MESQKGGIKVSSIITTSILIVILVISFNVFRKYYFNGFEKAIADRDTRVIFTRDSEIKYSEERSYKIENKGYNDSAIYKEIEVQPNTPYRISCMVKTEDIKCKLDTTEGGAIIGLLDTTEYSEAITGTNDWQRIEFMFNSKNKEKVKISFRLGGNENDCKGTAWFSDFKVEKGIRREEEEWNIGCFILKNVDVNIEGKQYTLQANSTDIENVKINLERYKNDCYNFSNEKMIVNYEIYEIEEPLTTISHSEEHGYYITYYNIKDLIYPKVKEKEYDHIFVVCRMENDEGTISIPIYDDWIGLGNMDMYGIGYSLIRINSKANTHIYKYGMRNHLPEEVYLHEFLHTLERNNTEYGYETPALHDYEKYGYTEDSTEGLKGWYKDYMVKNILDRNTSQYVGLDEFVYTTQPPNSTNFTYPIDIEFNTEPKNIIEEALSIFDVLLK